MAGRRANANSMALVAKNKPAGAQANSARQAIAPEITDPANAANAINRYLRDGANRTTELLITSRLPLREKGSRLGDLMGGGGWLDGREGEGAHGIGWGLA